MRKQTRAQRRWIKMIAVVLIFAFLCDQSSFALQPDRRFTENHTLNPESRFMPVVKGEGFSMREQEPELTRRLKDDAGLLYVSHLIGKVLAANGSIISARGLKRLVKRHVSHIGAISFDIDGLRKDGMTFCLPYTSPDTGRQCTLRYYLSEDEPVVSLGADSILIGVGSARVIFEETEPFEVPDREVYVRIEKIRVPADPSAEEEERIDDQIAEFLSKYDLMMGAKRDYAEDVIREMKLNLHEHGNGGTIKVLVGAKFDLNPNAIRIVVEDNGPGLSGDLNDIIRKSFRRSEKREGGQGLLMVAFVPDETTVETGGKRWVRKEVSALTTDIFVEDGKSDMVMGTRLTMDFSLDTTRQRIKSPGKEFKTKLEGFGLYKKQDTFLRTRTFNRSGAKLPTKSRGFLLHAIDVYFQDTPIHDLQTLVGYVMEKEVSGEVDADVAKNMITEIQRTAARLREYYYAHYPENTETWTDKESDDFIQAILALKGEQLSIIDGLIMSLTDLAPGAELVHDGAVYFRLRAAQFFEDLHQKHRRILFADAMVQDRMSRGPGGSSGRVSARQGTGEADLSREEAPDLSGDSSIADSEADVVTKIILTTLGVDQEKLDWEKEAGGYYTAIISATELNWNAAQTAFNLPEDSLPGGSVLLVQYKDRPIYAFLRQGNKPAHVLELLRYYKNIEPKRAADIAGGIIKIANVRGVTRFMIDKPYPPYIYAAAEPSDEISPVTHMPSQRRLEVFAHIRIPVLPGVFGGTHTSSNLSASAAAKYAGAGKRVLVIGTGAGTEAVLAAKKGAIVDAVDIKEMAIANTKLTCSIAGVEDKVNVFRNDLFSGLGKYDLIVFNMPHYYDARVPAGRITPSGRNLYDVEGAMLRKLCLGISEHLTPQGKALLVNSADAATEHLFRKYIPEDITLQVEEGQGSRLYVLTKRDREKHSIVIRSEPKPLTRPERQVREVFSDSGRQKATTTMPILRPGLTEEEVASRTNARDRFEQFLDAIRKGRYQDGRVVDLRKLPQDKEIILIGDLHERLDNLRKILADERTVTVGGDKVTKTVQQMVEDGDAVLIFLGDAVHAELGKGKPLDLSMERSLEMMKWIAELKTQNPDNVYYVLGNHDDIDWPCSKNNIDQSEIYREKLSQAYGLPAQTGSKYMDLYREFIRISPIMLIADGLVATHAGPAKNATLRQIKHVTQEKITEDFKNNEYAVAMVLWGRHEKIFENPSFENNNDLTEEQKRFVAQTLYSDKDVIRFLKRMGQPKGVFVSGHTPQLLPAGSFYSRVSDHQFIVYAGGPFAGYAAYRKGSIEMVDINKRLAPRKYKVLSQGKERSFWRKLYEKVIKRSSSGDQRFWDPGSPSAGQPADSNRASRRRVNMYREMAVQARQFIEENKTRYWDEGLRITTSEGHAYEV
ncbi:MAG: metallophosphoesterase [Candidatus Tantalella remota]|nr:metallophosphoesterase [Candidatus Tantalella remota]